MSKVSENTLENQDVQFDQDRLLEIIGRLKEENQELKKENKKLELSQVMVKRGFPNKPDLFDHLLRLNKIRMFAELYIEDSVPADNEGKEKTDIQYTFNAVLEMIESLNDYYRTIKDYE